MVRITKLLASILSQQLTLELRVELDWNWLEPISSKFHQVPLQFHR